jgi:hypothetical protein
MAGYASRTRPAEGKTHDLYAKALALEDSQGTRLVLVTTDLIGLPRGFSGAVAERIEQTLGLPRPRLMLTASHTHCGPVLLENLPDAHPLPDEQIPLLQKYRDELEEKLVRLVQEAVRDLRPATLWQGKGTARFAVNRRQVTERGIINGFNPDGPVDHDVPVLEVRAADGTVRAVVFGYACHNTTLQFFQWCGDYAGFAQQELEQRHPGVAALFWAGCGGDANPLPRGTVELCMKYGRELADAVDAARHAGLQPIRGPFRAAYATVPLPFASTPSREQLIADSLSNNHMLRNRAKRFLRQLEEGRPIPDQYPEYPVQVWRLDRELVWLALGGEVVVDYALRLKRELGGPRQVWVTAYANDVMAYIPSERVLREGGYEGDSSMIAYGMPGKWAEGIENRIVTLVRELVRKVEEPEQAERK